MLTLYRRIFAVLGLMATADWTLRTHQMGNVKLFYALIFVWFIGVVCLVFPRVARLGSLIMVISALTLVVVSHHALYSQHVSLLVLIAAILGVARESEVSLLLKIQLTVAYAFAAVAKVNESYLSGDVLYQYVIKRPFWESLHLFTPSSGLLILAGVLAVLTEAFLSFALWFPRLRWLGLAVAIPFHIVLILFVGTTDVVHVNRLILFALLMFLMYIPFFQDVLLKRWPSLSQWGSGSRLDPKIRASETAL